MVPPPRVVDVFGVLVLLALLMCPVLVGALGALGSAARSKPCAICTLMISVACEVNTL